MYLFHNRAMPPCRATRASISNRRDVEIDLCSHNIWAGAEYALSNANPAQPLDLDYDDLYTTFAWRTGLVGWLVRSSPQHAGRAAAATGQELHGLNVAPGFANAANGDHTLSAASPLIDKGRGIPGNQRRLHRRRAGRGAFEYQGFGFTLAALPRRARSRRVVWPRIRSACSPSAISALPSRSPRPALLQCDARAGSFRRQSTRPGHAHADRYARRRDARAGPMAHRDHYRHKCKCHADDERGTACGRRACVPAAGDANSLMNVKEPGEKLSI